MNGGLVDQEVKGKKQHNKENELSITNLVNIEDEENKNLDIIE